MNWLNLNLNLGPNNTSPTVHTTSPLKILESSSAREKPPAVRAIQYYKVMPFMNKKEQYIGNILERLHQPALWTNDTLQTTLSFENQENQRITHDVILQHILHYLTLGDACKLSLVSHGMNNVVQYYQNLHRSKLFDSYNRLCSKYGTDHHKKDKSIYFASLGYIHAPCYVCTQSTNRILQCMLPTKKCVHYETMTHIQLISKSCIRLDHSLSKQIELTVKKQLKTEIMAFINNLEKLYISDTYFRCYYTELERYVKLMDGGVHRDRVDHLFVIHYPPLFDELLVVRYTT
jgi:hypothetical protein